MGTPRAFASRAISLTLSWYLMFPGLIRSPCTPASSAAIAYFHWKWMSATTGIVDFAAMADSASASSQWGTATRTISQPDATNDAICWSVASTFAVFVMVMDWTRMGASPPTVTSPRRTCRDLLRSTIIVTFRLPGSAAEHVEHDLAVLRFIHLEQDQPLPSAEDGFPSRDGDGVGAGGQQHRLDV